MGKFGNQRVRIRPYALEPITVSQVATCCLSGTRVAGYKLFKTFNIHYPSPLVFITFIIFTMSNHFYLELSTIELYFLTACLCCQLQTLSYPRLENKWLFFLPMLSSLGLSQSSYYIHLAWYQLTTLISFASFSAVIWAAAVRSNWVLLWSFWYMYNNKTVFSYWSGSFKLWLQALTQIKVPSL